MGERAGFEGWSHCGPDEQEMGVVFISMHTIRLESIDFPTTTAMKL
jgi:hypothetical protein